MSKIGVNTGKIIDFHRSINLLVAKLYRSIDTPEATLDTSIASLQEIQRNWND